MENLGLLGLAIAVILVLAILVLVTRRLSLCSKITDLLRKKLFYNGVLRYVIVSYLKLANQFLSLFLLALTLQ